MGGCRGRQGVSDWVKEGVEKGIEKGVRGREDSLVFETGADLRVFQLHTGTWLELGLSFEGEDTYPFGAVFKTLIVEKHPRYFSGIVNVVVWLSCK